MSKELEPGQRFGNLVVVERDLSRPKRRFYICKCDCGNSHTVNSTDLRNGHTTVCITCAIKKRAGSKRLPDGMGVKNSLFYQYKKSAKLRGFEFDLTKEHFLKLIGQDCVYCGRPPSSVFRKHNKVKTGDFERLIVYYNGIDRVDNSLGYIPSNIVTCCAHCNVGKLTKSKKEFLEWVAAVYNHSIRNHDIS